MYDLDKRAGNTGLTGSYFWRIDNSDGRKALDRCFTWAFFQGEINFLYWHTVYVRWDWRMACPCSGWQAWFDRRFFWDWRKYSWPNWCFESRRSKYIWYYTGRRYVYFSMRQLCCYSTDWQDWGSLKIGSPDGSRVKMQLHYYYSYWWWWWNRDQSVYNDQQAYKYCCVDIPFCDFFYYFRPSDDCRRYIPPRRREYTLYTLSIRFAKHNNLLADQILQQTNRLSCL